jgi:hypothetical protein
MLIAFLLFFFFRSFIQMNGFRYSGLGTLHNYGIAQLKLLYISKTFLQNE